MRIPKRCANNFFQRMKEFRLYIKCKYMIIGRLISLKVLWESSYPNTPIKNELWTLFIILQTSYIIIFLIFYHFLIFILFMNQDYLPIFDLGFKATLPSSQSFQNYSRRIYRQVWSFCVTRQNFSHLANTLAKTNSLLVSDLCHLTNDIAKIYLCHLATG